MVLFGYNIVIKYLFKKKEPVRMQGFAPVTVIIDAFETKKFIEQKIDNLCSIHYPLENRKIIIISDTDPESIAALKSENQDIEFILSADKHDAYIEAFKLVDTDIVVFTDAETKLQKYSLRNVIECLNGKIAAVTGYFYLSDEPVKSYHKSKIKHHEALTHLNYLEGCIDSSSIINPRLLAVRRSLFKDFEEVIGATISESTHEVENGNLKQISRKVKQRHIPDEIAFVIRKQGLKAISDNKACLFEESPETAKSEVKKVGEKTARDIVVSYKYIKFLFNPRYGVFGMLTFPFRRFFIIHFPFIITFVVLYALYCFPVLTITSIFIFVCYLFISRNTFPAIFLLGVTRGWLEILKAGFSR
jgi:hypothetical protein